MKNLRIWDSKLLAESYSILNQIRQNIDQIVEELPQGANVSALPNSLVETNALYNIAMCYKVLFDTLLEAQLIKSGNIKPSNSIH